MKSFPLGATDLTQYEDLTQEERVAWLNPAQGSYHHFHVERMGVDTYRWRDSKTPSFFVGTREELAEQLLSLSLRTINPEHRTPLRFLPQDEIDKLFEGL